jgi:N-acetylmuramoyl-L-alanine amidase
MRKIDKIIIHCTATIEGKDFKAKDVDIWHKAKGWRCIGYHYLIDLDGTIEKGRPDEEVGAHCANYNKHSIGVCYVGGLDKNKKPKDTRTQAQKDALWKLLIDLLTKYPDAIIYGHNELSKKACPCFDCEKEYYVINLKRNAK